MIDMLIQGAALYLPSTIGAKLMPILAADDAVKPGAKGWPLPEGNHASAFSVGNFFDNFSVHGLRWAYAIIGVLGVLAICGGGYMLVTGLLSQGRKQTSWPLVIGLLLVGGIMAFGGWNMFAGTIAAGGYTTVNTWQTE